MERPIPLPDDSKQALPCGSWPSPVTAALAAGKTVTFSSVSATEAGVFWLERRPAEGGRTALVQARPEGATRYDVRDLLPPDFDVATRVHEYGGGAYAAQGRRIVFSNRADGCVYACDVLEGTSPLSPARIGGQDRLRYADFSFDPHGTTVFAVREDHRADGEPANTLVALQCATTDGGAARPQDSGGIVIAQGADFYSSPRPSPDGRYLAWVEWDHPSMPWDSTRLCIAPIHHSESGPTLGKADVVAGRAGESVIEPRWRDAATLIVLSDRSGWWTPYRVSIPDGASEALIALEEEIGQPHWVFGQRSISLLDDGTVLALSVKDGVSRIIRLSENDSGGAWTVASPPEFGHPDQCPVPCPWDDPSSQSPLFAWLDARPDGAAAIVTGDGLTPPHVIRAATELPFGAPDIAMPEPIRFPLEDGGEGHAIFYAPTNARCCVPATEKPPMIVTAHGGPTARANESFAFKVQWWTSRGFAVLDVNYGGSTGFGRAYRKLLDGEWGVRDVADCVAAARHMAVSGAVDPDRIAIRGSSAGGLTVLAALATSDVFAAGVSVYGVTDLRALAQDTHKFEARYLDGLIGPWPAAEAVYVARSPLFMADRIRCPVLFLQGLDDKVVPPSQARSMVKALQDNGIVCALHEFAGEGHGFRGEATIRQSFELELAFYGRVFGFTPAPAARAGS